MVDAVYVQDIASTERHGLFDARGCTAMGKGQVEDELAAQLADL